MDCMDLTENIQKAFADFKKSKIWTMIKIPRDLNTVCIDSLYLPVPGGIFQRLVTMVSTGNRLLTDSRDKSHKTCSMASTLVKVVTK